MTEPADSASRPWTQADHDKLRRLALSRRIALLEERLKSRLLQRSTRHSGMTEVGEIYYRHCVAMIAEAAQEAIDNTSAEPRGMIRVTCRFRRTGRIYRLWDLSPAPSPLALSESSRQAYRERAATGRTRSQGVGATNMCEWRASDRTELDTDCEISPLPISTVRLEMLPLTCAQSFACSKASVVPGQAAIAGADHHRPHRRN